jgi:hypothetical protein
MQPSDDSAKLDKNKVDKLQMLWSIINGLVASEFTGYLKLNFSQGNLGKIEKTEVISKQ